MRKFLVILLALPLWTTGQVNLVPNPSFETFSACPGSTGEVYRATPWYTPGGSSDYFNPCTSNWVAQVPINLFGNQQPHTGNSYCGFGVLVDNNPLIREYVSIGLTETLKSNKSYCVIFYVSLAEGTVYPESFLSISNLGAYFSTDTIKQIPAVSILNYTPQVENPDYNFLSDTLGWMKVEGSFIATGGERFMTIGNFRDDAHTLSDTVKPVPPGYLNETYYYIDDVSVYYCGEDTTEHANELEIVNAFTPNGDGKNDYFNIKGTNISTVHLKIINRWGQLLYEATGENPGWDGKYDGNEVSEGVYYYIVEVTFIDGEIRNKAGSIQLIR